MRWSYPYGTAETEARILGLQGDPLEAFETLAGLGYSAVELFVRDPAAFSHAALADALARSGLGVAALGTGPLVADDHFSLTSEHSGVRRATVERLKAVVDLGAEFAPQVNIGKIRGALAPDPTQARTWMRDGLVEVADYAATVGVVITIEPQSSAILDNINTCREGVDFVTSLGRPNIRLLIDTYHAELEEAWPSLAYVRVGALLHHVHFADTDRLAPGQGRIDFALHVATLRAIGYDGYVTFEISQGNDPSAAAKAAIDHLAAIEAQDDS